MKNSRLRCCSKTVRFGVFTHWSTCVFAVLACFASRAFADQTALSRYEFLEIRMGIPVTIVLYAPTEELAQEASRAAYSRIRELDRIMSDYDPDSELMKLCKNAAPGKPVQVSDELFYVLQQAQELSRQSDGAFDVTVGPLVKLWRSARRNKRLPDADKLQAAMQVVGHGLYELDSETKQVTLKKPGLQIDLGAIAKGYAADEALKALKSHGVTRGLVEAGGDISLGDPPPGRNFWRVEIEKVRGEADAPLVLRLANQAVATSGDAYQYLQIDGVRYSHLLDPKTGIGITRPGSVTVIAPDCLTADGLASALTVLGPQQGLKLLEQKPDTHALYLLSPPVSSPTGDVERIPSAGFDDLLMRVD